jgi:hypothetical protein
MQVRPERRERAHPNDHHLHFESETGAVERGFLAPYRARRWGARVSPGLKPVKTPG